MLQDIGFTYDGKGNLTAEPGATYSYDSQSRMTDTQKNGDTYSYAYDGDGNRVSQTVNGNTTYYLVDRIGGLSQVVAEVASDNSIAVFYVRGDDLISQWRGGSVSYYGYDGHGSTVLLTDGTGADTDRWFYDAWGSIIERTGTTTNVYRYTGQQQDGTGLYYLRARRRQTTTAGRGRSPAPSRTATTTTDDNDRAGVGRDKRHPALSGPSTTATTTANGLGGATLAERGSPPYRQSGE